MRGVGFEYDTKTGFIRNWFIDANGIKRWVDNDEEIVATQRQDNEAN